MNFLVGRPGLDRFSNLRYHAPAIVTDRCFFVTTPGFTAGIEPGPPKRRNGHAESADAQYHGLTLLFDELDLGLTDGHCLAGTPLLVSE